MSALAMLLSAASGVMLLGSGYLYGARRGRWARAALARAHAEANERLAALDHALTDRGAPEVDALREEVRSVLRALGDQERNQDALRAELRQGLARLATQSSDPEKLQRELQTLMAPLLRRTDDAANLRDMMKALRPLVERDRLGKELSNVQAAQGMRELPRMLDDIAEKGSFTTVVLSDDAGLPLAANGNATDVETHAAAASWLVGMVERAEGHGDAPRPLSFVVHDSWNHYVLHRIFEVDAQRFTLTAVSRGMHVGPGALDAALGKIERVLAVAGDRA